MCSTHDERMSVIAEGFISTLKNKIYKHMTAISQIEHFNVLNYIVDEYNNIQSK